MSNAIESKGARWVLAVLLGTLGMVNQGVRAEDLMIPLEGPRLNFIGAGYRDHDEFLDRTEAVLERPPGAGCDWILQHADS